MTDLSFSLIDVTQRSRRKFNKTNKYDPIITQFCEGTSSLCKVEVPTKNANYVRLQLKKRIDVRELNNLIKVSVVNNVAYLEKIA